MRGDLTMAQTLNLISQTVVLIDKALQQARGLIKNYQCNNEHRRSPPPNQTPLTPGRNEQEPAKDRVIVRTIPANVEPEVGYVLCSMECVLREVEKQSSRSKSNAKLLQKRKLFLLNIQVLLHQSFESAVEANVV